MPVERVLLRPAFECMVQHLSAKCGWREGETHPFAMPRIDLGGDAAGFGILVLHRMPFPGALFLFACSGYAAGRLVLESFREYAGHSSKFNVHHAVSAAIIALAAIIFSAKWLR